jgi:hypothetical protein
LTDGNILGGYASTIDNVPLATGRSADYRDRALFACLNDGELAFNQLRPFGGKCVNEPFGSKKNDHC